MALTISPINFSQSVIPASVRMYNGSGDPENGSGPEGLPLGLVGRDDNLRFTIHELRSTILTPGQIALYATAGLAAIGVLAATRNTNLGRFAFAGALAFVGGCGFMTTKIYVCPDADGDGYTNEECDGEGAIIDSGVIGYGDCDDDDASIHPNAEEYCDGIDNDCNEEVDEYASDDTHYYEDSDGDGYGNPESDTIACEQPEGYVENSDDCNDEDASINPEATEECDDVDNDCDEEIDEGTSTYAYQDADGDGYGNPNMVSTECPSPDGYVSNHDDCDDGDDDVNPGEEEVEGNGIDDNCNGLEDELIVGGCNSSHDYTSIQDAVDDAIAAVGAQTIYICAGNYNESITAELDDNLQIVGESGTVLSGDPSDTMNVDIPSSTKLLLDYLEFDNPNGQGIIQQGDGHLSVVGCKFRNHNPGASGFWGAAILSGYGGSNGKLSIFASSFTDNIHAYGGGAIYFEGRELFVYGTTFSGNRADAGVSGGGAIYLASGEATIEDSIVENNYSDITGGGVYMLYVYGDTTLESINTEWSNNDPNDIGGDTIDEYTAGSQTDFTCISSLGTCE